MNNHNHEHTSGEMHHQHGHSKGQADGSGHQHHHKMMIADFKKRFWVSLVLSIPVVIISQMIQEIFSFTFSIPYASYIAFVLSSVIYFYGGKPFLTGLFDELKKRAPGMMTLIAVAISTAYLYSSATVFGLEGVDFFWELATLIDIMLLGHWIEMKSVMGASRSLEALAAMLPSEAHLVHNDHVMDVRLEELKKDDLILVKPGEKVPADGTIADGESYLNESLLTGESKPVKKGKDDRVIGGSINGNGSLKIKVLHTGSDSYLNKVISLVEDAQKAKSKTQHLADKAAKWLTYAALLVGVVTLTAWLIAGYVFVYALERMVTVMVISCPHALGLAIPLVVAISTAISAQNGLLIRNRTAFENSRKISLLLFDKTGTLTEGNFGVSRFDSVVRDLEKNDLLRLAGALEQNSEHPVASGIIRKCEDLDLTLPKVENFNAITGKGVEARVGGKAIKVVSPGYLKEKNISLPDEAMGSEAETVVFVIIDDQLSGYIALADSIRPESKQAIEILKQNGIKVMMVTGDNKRVAEAVSDELGLDGFYAEVLPDEKQDIVKKLQSEGEFVAMTGDGVNDAPALAQADVGIAVGSGSDVAAETADIILVNSNPQDILNLVLFGKKTYNKMIQNLAWAAGYNVITIPLAAGVLYKTGFMLSPAVGALLMSLSTIVVAFNAQLLKFSIKSKME